jgi:hypothetical protein
MPAKRKKNTQQLQQIQMPIRDTCKTIGVTGFVTAIGVGLVAYSATHIYVCFCAPEGIWGFVQSLVVMDSTFCQMLMALISHSQTLYGTMMMAFLFGIIGSLGKCVNWMTGESTITTTPTSIKGRSYTLPKSESNLT